MTEAAEGCSGGMNAAWRLLSGRPPPWDGCCVVHDRAYRRGGTAADRLRADRELLVGVILKGSPFWAFAMYLAVRAFGHRYFRFT